MQAEELSRGFAQQSCSPARVGAGSCAVTPGQSPRRAQRPSMENLLVARLRAAATATLPFVLPCAVSSASSRVRPLSSSSSSSRLSSSMGSPGRGGASQRREECVTGCAGWRGRHDVRRRTLNVYAALQHCIPSVRPEALEPQQMLCSGSHTEAQCSGWRLRHSHLMIATRWSRSGLKPRRTACSSAMEPTALASQRHQHWVQQRTGNRAPYLAQRWPKPACRSQGTQRTRAASRRATEGGRPTPCVWVLPGCSVHCRHLPAVLSATRCRRPRRPCRVTSSARRRADCGALDTTSRC